MKTLLVLSVVVCWLAPSHSGVVPWSHQKEEEAIRLYRAYCLHGDKGVNGDIRWHCKKPYHQLSEEVFEHHKVITARPQNAKQIIFIQAPSKSYRHNVYVKGEAEFNQDTDIYVVPGKDRHQVNIQGDISTRQGQGGKPHTFYLKKNPAEHSNFYPSAPDHHYHDPSYPSSPYPSYKPQHEAYSSYYANQNNAYSSSLVNPGENYSSSYGSQNTHSSSYGAQDTHAAYSNTSPQTYEHSASEISPQYAQQSNYQKQNLYADEDNNFVTPHPDTVRRFG